MLPELFRIPGVNWPIYGYGLMMVLGFFLAMELANLLDAINISSGGLTFYGGLVLATFACIAYGVWRKVPLRLGMDIVAPCVMLGLAFGRVGCFLNGCCYGAACDASWAVRFPYQAPAYVDQWRDGKVAPPPALTRN